MPPYGEGRMKSQKFTDSINHAIDGLIYAVKTEKNIRLHFLATFVIFTLCLWLDLDKNDFLFICISVTLVIMAEMFNTAVESIVNLLTLSHHPLAKIAKDVSAGSVLIACMNALAVAYLVILQAVKKPTLNDVFNSIKQHYTHGVIIIIALILIMVLIFKSMGGKGSFTRGGIVSGHAAIAFAASTTIYCISRNVLIAAIAFGLALLVAQSRIEAKFHRMMEVLLGALLGILISLLVFQIFFSLRPFFK
jgi:diacylglycerol kinase (ATP)